MKSGAYPEYMDLKFFKAEKRSLKVNTPPFQAYFRDKQNLNDLQLSLEENASLKKKHVNYLRSKQLVQNVRRLPSVPSRQDCETYRWTF